MLDKRFLTEEFFLDDASTTKQRCELIVFEPETSPEGGKFCTVRLFPILKSDKKIFGATESQAKQLAINFLKQMLAGKALTDSKGIKLEIASSGVTRVFA